MEIEEGESYTIDELPESDLSYTKLESVKDGVFAAQYGEYYVTFERQEVVCTDVTHVDDIET